ncbi:MAG TPA: HAD family hydrolase [Clostridia bacterium]|nr:HAD family hydrolase [Clostridia bacterium]
MPPFRILATDLDHTLLREDLSLSEKTLTALCRCRDQGMRIVLATARPYRTAVRFCASFCYDAIVCLNGAAVYEGGHCVQVLGMKKGLARTLAAQARRLQPDAGISMESNDTLYANFDISELWKETAFHMLDASTDFSDMPDFDVEKILLSNLSPEAAQRLSAILPESLFLDRDRVGLSFIQRRDVNKINGLRCIAQRWNVPLREIVAFGDDLADADMLAACGRGVAMSNALEAVQAAADEVCLSNQEDGVARWLEAHCLSNR